MYKVFSAKDCDVLEKELNSWAEKMRGCILTSEHFFNVAIIPGDNQWTAVRVFSVLIKYETKSC